MTKSSVAGGLKSKKSIKTTGWKAGAYNPKFEVKIKELIKELEESGFKVRREELKKGLGWKVTSGSCRLFEDNVLFVDRSLTQLEQIEFLSGKLDLNRVKQDKTQENPTDNQVSS